jgi:hypothetical protein
MIQKPSPLEKTSAREEKGAANAMVRSLWSLASLEERLTRAPTYWFVLAFIPLVILVIYALVPPKSPLLGSDSPSYMYFDPSRPIGYPTFVYIIKHVTGNYECLRYLQLTALCLSAYVTAISLSQYFRQLFVPVLFEAGALGHPGLVRLTDSIASDALSACAFLLFIAAVFYFGRAPSLRRYGIVCVMVALALTLRPVNIAMVPPALLLPLFFRGELRGIMIRGLAIGLVSAVAGWGATPVANMLLHGWSATSYILAVNLFHRTIYIEPGKEPRPKECDADFIEEITAPVANYLKGVPSEFAGILRFQYTEYVRFASIVPGLVSRHQLTSDSQTYPMLMCYTFARYRQSPVAMLWDIGVNYWNLLSSYTFIGTDTRNRMLTFLESHPPVSIPTFPHSPRDLLMHRAAIAEVGVGSDNIFVPWTFEPPPARPLALILGVKIAQVSAWTVSVLLVVTLLPAALGIVRNRDMIVLALISLAVQLNLLIAVVADSAQPRYVFPVWAGLWLALIWGFSRLLAPGYRFLAGTHC